MKRQAKALSAATLSLFALLLLAAGPAQASKGVVDVLGANGTGPALPGMAGDSCLASDPNSCLARPTGIAVNQTTGDLYVADYGNARVVRLDENGVFERAWGWDVDADDPGTGFEICIAPASCRHGVAGDGIGQLDLPSGIAVDQSNGDVYVTGRGADEKFDLDGNLIRTLALGDTDPVDVKPVSNSVLVGGTTLSWLDSSGNPLATFDLGDPGYDAWWIGADSAGSIYASAGVAGRSALKFSTAGTPLGKFAPEVLDGHLPSALEVDPVNDRIYVARFDRPVPGLVFEGALNQIAELDSSGQLIDLHATGMPYRINDLAANSSSGRLYVTVGTPEFSGRPGIESHLLVIDTVTNAPVPVITSIDPTADGVTVEGTVNPQGTDFPTGYHWEYRKQGTQDWTSSPATDVMVGNGTDPEPAGPEEITDLEPNTTYEVRLVAVRQGGAGSAIDTDSFQTLAVPADVSERGAYPVGDTTAQLRAVINPKNSDTDYHFEYGTDESYGSTTPVRIAATANEAVPLYATVRGLQPETTYHFRVVADNGIGDPVEGEDLEFTTRSSAEMAWPTRGVELASPPETGSQNVVGLISRETDHVYWATAAGAPGSPTGSLGAFVAERTLNTPNGWESRSMLPSIEHLIGGGQATYAAIGASPDSRSIVFQVPFGPSVFWVRTNPDGTQTELAETEASEVATSAIPQTSSDLAHVLILDKTRLAGSAHPNGSHQVYDIGSGSPRLVSRMPGGKAPGCGVPEHLTGTVGSGFGDTEYEGFSRNVGPGVSLRVFFETPGADCTAPRQLYVNDDKGTATATDDETTLISGPPVSGPSEWARFLRANPAGNQAVYATATRVTAADTDSTEDLYKWTLGEGSECLTCDLDAPGDVRYGAGTREVIVASDLSAVYFRSPNQLVAGEGIPGSADNLWLLRDEEGGVEVTYVGQGGSDPATSEASEDGEVLVFKTDAAGVTPDRTGGFAQYYRYDSTDGSIECITCPPPGVAAQPVEGAPTAGSIAIGSIYKLTKNKLLSADGSTFAFTSPVAYVPEDINGGTDVYEWRRDGRLRLVSNGETRFPEGIGSPSLSGISADGKNILFTVAAKLTGFEIDGTRQVFVARTGGGFPPPDPPPDPCVEDACQGPLVAPPPLRNFGSKSVQGAGNVRATAPARARARRCSQRKVRRGKRCVPRRTVRKRACARKAKKAKKGKGKQRCRKTTRRVAASKEGRSK